VGYKGPDQMALFWLVGLPVASVGHGALVLMVLLAHGPAQPLVPPDMVMEVAMVTLHRDADVLPEKVMVKPPMVTGDMGVKEEPIADDQMILEQEDEDDAEGEDKETPEEKERREKREELIASAAQVPTGPETNLPTDPESTVTDLKDVYLTGSGTNVADPELADYIRKCKDRIMRKWHVMPAIANENPNLEVVVGLRIDREGKILKSKIVDPSGNRQYDFATLSAVRQMGSLPRPPSDKVMGYAEDGVFIRFKASDKVF